MDLDLLLYFHFPPAAAQESKDLMTDAIRSRAVMDLLLRQDDLLRHVLSLLAARELSLFSGTCRCAREAVRGSPELSERIRAGAALLGIDVAFRASRAAARPRHLSPGAGGTSRGGGPPAVTSARGAQWSTPALGCSTDGEVVAR
jgi:hypothetical protein